METKGRLLFLDQFRGLAVVLMVLANALAEYDRVPAFLQHAPADGFTLPDIVVPMFLFAMGYAVELSFWRRVQKNGALKTVSHLIVRNFILIAFGLLCTLDARNHGWNILQALGTTGLLAIPLLFLSPAVRLSLALLSLVTFQVGVSFFYDKIGVAYFLECGLVGPIGTFSWIFILIMGSCLPAWLKERQYASKITWLAVTGAILMVVGAGLSPLIPFSKHLGSSSYVLLSTGICTYGLMLLMAISEQFHISLPPLETLGKNALVLYVLSGILILWENKILPPDVSLPVCLMGFCAVMLLTYLIGAFLEGRNTYVKL